MIREIRDRAQPLQGAADLEPLVRAAADARVVLLGEASHGTHDFYAWRAAITERLVSEHGFRIVAVEGDWPDCARIDRFVRGEGDDPRATLAAFQRWPTWMWANEEIADLMAWMRGWNEGHPRDLVGFHGLDVYSLWDSIAVVVRTLEARDPEAAKAAREAYRCFEPWHGDEQAYARATQWVPADCEDEVVAVLRDIAARREGSFDVHQNALVAANAEAYYRAMVRSSAESWNVRDRHMMETLERLLAREGPDAKAIVWAHNTHVGDARATDMADEGMTNLGQLCRERLGAEATFVVGFTSHHGSVIAGRAWDAPWEKMRLPGAMEGSWENAIHEALSGEDALLMLRGARWRETRGQRAVGVVYHPEWESGNYVPTDLAARYDALLHLDETRALAPLPVRRVDDGEEPPETWPTGF